MITFVRTVVSRATVTACILVACIIVFGLEAVGATDYDVLQGTGDRLSPVLALGVVYRPAIDAGEWWRLITAGFLHFGVLHLLLNMYALLFVGLALESRYGSLRFAIIYAVALVGGNLAADWFQSPQTISAGASGAIMGLFGAMVVIGLRFRFRRDWIRSAGVPIAFTFAYGLSHPEVSNAAHIGGLLAGFGAAWIVGVSPKWAQLTRAQEKTALVESQRLEE